MEHEKRSVQEFWEAESCGEVYARGDDVVSQFREHAEARYRLEPYIEHFARFEEARGEDVLEIGVGMGADHVRLARAAPQSLTGIDLTLRAVDWTKQRIAAEGLSSGLAVSDAERLPFRHEAFSVVYSWGVLHHSPDTSAAVKELYRVLRPGGRARVMIYHSRSIVGYLLWLRYGLFRGRPRRALTEIYAEHLESPGTKAYSVSEAEELFSAFRETRVRVQLSSGDLLQGAAGQRHGSPALSLARALWPRTLIRRYLPRHGLFLLIEAVKE